MKMNRLMRRLRFLAMLISGTLVLVYVFTFGLNIFAAKSVPGPKDAQIAERLKAHVRKLSEELGERDMEHYPQLLRAADYILKELESYGYKVSLQEYICEGKKVENVYAQKTGSAAPAESIVAGAHYDTVATTGADDNASGVATVLELARVLKDKPTARSIDFCFFTNEEEPFFRTEAMGSRIFVHDALRRAENIRAAVIFDMTGYYTNGINSQRYFPMITGLFLPNRGNFISIFSNWRSGELSNLLLRSFKNNSRFPIVLLTTSFDPAVDFSDHWSFWKEGYLTVMVTDTVGLRNKKYHTMYDTWDTLDYKSMACVVEGFDAAVLDLANRRL